MTKFILVLFISFILFVYFGCKENYIFAQSSTTQGKEFYFSFMQNGYRTCNLGGSAAYEWLTCIISAKNACTGSISNPNTLWSANFSVGANGIATVDIPIAESYSTNSEVIENKGLIVTATDTISLFIANEATNSFDASNVLPIDALGDKYVTQNYIPSTTNISGSCNTNIRSAFIIIATENSTVIDITPTCNTMGGKIADTTFSITLNKGQSYQLMSNSKGTSGDLSGSLIQARDCKKIAVFNGNILTGVPITMSNGFDHIFEQAMPVSYWGNKFAITASKARQGDFIRITALNNNTQIKCNDTILATVNERNTHEFFLSDSSCYLETTEPCAVYLYQTTGNYDNSTEGDPSMVWITPIEQQVEEITFGTFTATNTITNHYINIVTETVNVDSIWLDNINISNQFSVLSGNQGFSFARIIISHGTHTLRSNTGFTAYVYGFGNVRGYAYSIGSSAKYLTGNIQINDTQVSDNELANGVFLCNDLLDFKLNINYEFDSVNWDFGDGTIVNAGDSITHAYLSTGQYSVQVIIKLQTQNCIGSIYDTIVGIIHISHITDTIRDTICYGQIYNNYRLNIIALQDTSIIQYLTNSYSCDSLITLYLTVLDTSLHIINDTILSGESYFDWGFFLPSNNLTYTGTNTYNLLLSNRFNCDSLHILNLTIKPTYLFKDTVTVCQLEEINWRNKKITTSNLGTYVIYDTLKTVYWNTDSIYCLMLIVKPSYLFYDTLSICQHDDIKWHNIQLTTSSSGVFALWDSLKTMNYGCDSIYHLTLNINPIPEIFSTLPNDDTICSGDIISKIVFSGSGNVYEWSISGDTIDGIPTSGKDTFGEYTLENKTDKLLTTTISVIPKSNFGNLICSGEMKSFNISVYPTIKIDATANKTLFCHGDSIYFYITNGNQLHNFQWSGVNGFSSTIQNPVIENVSEIHSGNYIIHANTVNNCAVIADTVSVYVLAFIDPDLPEDTVMCQDPITIQTTYPNGNFLWNTGETSRQIKVSSSGMYWVEINDQGCLGRDTVIVRQIIIPSFDIQTLGDICVDDIMELSVNIENANYLWNTGETTSSIVIDSKGEYSVAVFIEECFMEKSIAIDCDCHLWIPNTFTPNNDGSNEIFIPIPTEKLNSFSMFIYDRWGSLIYRTNTYTSWNGKTIDGKYAAAGIYAYFISYSCINNPDKKIKKQGRINLIR